MAERRMVSISLIDDDRFLDMSQGAQFLYFHLTMRADDDGFITPKKVMRLVGASQKDLDSLINAGFLIPFESGVVVITHWRVNNTIRKDRYTPTSFQKEFSELIINNGVYEKYSWQPMVTENPKSEQEQGHQKATDGKPDDNQQTTSGCQGDNQSGNHTATTWQPMVATGKDRIGKKEYSHISLSGECSYQKETTSPGNQMATSTSPPALDEVKAYFRGNLLSGDPERFFYTYQSRGWIDAAGIPVRDWHAKAMNWSIDEKSRKDNGGSRDRPRDYDGSYDSHGMKEVSI